MLQLIAHISLRRRIISDFSGHAAKYHARVEAGKYSKVNTTFV